MNTLVITFTLWFCSSPATAAIQDELMALRLENLKTAMNARDYDLAMYRVRQIDVLDRACARETQKGKIPFSCFELRETEIQVNATARRRIFAVTSLESLNSLCIAAINKPVGEIFAESRNLRRPVKLTRECQSLYEEKAAIQQYKRTGRRIE